MAGTERSKKRNDHISFLALGEVNVLFLKDLFWVILMKLVK